MNRGQRQTALLITSQHLTDIVTINFSSDSDGTYPFLEGHHDAVIYTLNWIDVSVYLTASKEGGWKRCRQRLGKGKPNK